MKRLICWIRGHKPVKMITATDLEGVAAGTVQLTATKWHFECLRCGEQLPS